MIKKLKRKDNTLEDFPPGTLFEIGMLEGCAAGLIHAEGDSSNYFYGVTQPIYFKAAETIEGESDTVKLLVGLIKQQQGGMQMVGEGEKEIQPEVKSNYLKSPPGGVPTNPLGFACFTGDFVEQITAPANVVVQDECDFENCGNWSYNDLTVSVIPQHNYFEEIATGFIITVCKIDDPEQPLGQSQPVAYDRKRKNQSVFPQNSWNLVPCTATNDIIQFKIVDPITEMPTPIFIDFVADVCYTLIYLQNLILINDSTEFKDASIVANPQIAMQNFCGHYCYPQRLTNPGYLIKEVVELHEQLHLDHFRQILNDLRESLVTNLIQYRYTCKEYHKFYKNIEEVATEFESKIYQYVYNAIIEYYLRSGIEFKVDGSVIVPANTVIEERNEKRIQSNLSIQNMISSYMTALNRARNVAIPICPTCP